MLRSVFIYEFLTAGGCWSLGSDPPAGSLLTEGTVMRDALARDFAAMSTVEAVHLMYDVRLPLPTGRKLILDPVRRARDELALIAELATEADAIILIAPEFSQLLSSRVHRCEPLRDKLLSPSSAVVQLCSDKQRTCEYLTLHGIPTPRGGLFSANSVAALDQSPFLAVLKPVDGAGSQSVRLINDAAELSSIDFSTENVWRLEDFHPGTPVSVSLLAGPRGYLALQPCTQHLSDDGKFSYRGGSTPISLPLAERAQRLALAAAKTLPPTRGYLGIDIVLGSAENGSEDVVIEINPRLTTSYLGLRQACEQNLAEAMWKWATGEPVSLTWHKQTISFSADVPCLDAP